LCNAWLEKLYLNLSSLPVLLIFPNKLIEGEVFNQVPDKGFDFNQVLTGKDAAFLTFKQGSGSMRGVWVTLLSFLKYVYFASLNATRLALSNIKKKSTSSHAMECFAERNCMMNF